MTRWDGGRDLVSDTLAAFNCAPPAPHPPLRSPPSNQNDWHPRQRRTCNAYSFLRLDWLIFVSANVGDLMQAVLVAFSESQTVAKVWPEQRRKMGCEMCVFVCFFMKRWPWFRTPVVQWLLGKFVGVKHQKASFFCVNPGIKRRLPLFFNLFSHLNS